LKSLFCRTPVAAGPSEIENIQNHVNNEEEEPKKEIDENIDGEKL
jgi:hypothetical protein